MLRNNLKIAFRTLRNNKIYTVVTFLGLTIGVAASLLIFRMVTYELSFNKSFKHYDRIVRVVSTAENAQGDIEYNVCTPGPAMGVIQDRISQFEESARIKEFWVTLAQPDPNGGPPLKKFSMDPRETGFFTTPAFFKIFDQTWIVGDPATALKDPNVIVLTRPYAEKFFGSAEMAMGQQLVMDNLVPVVVKGVVEPLPENSDFNIPFYSSWETIRAYPDHFFHDEENWGNCSSNNQLYALMRDMDQLDDANALLATVGEEEYRNNRNRRDRTHFLQPLSDLHFNEQLGHSGTHRISRGRIRVLSGVGILILIMACFNFINLATAQSSLRAKEVGVRKTLGSSKRQLVAQFLSETGLIVVCSVLLGLIVARLALPFLQQISNVPEGVTLIADPLIWAYLLVIAVVVTVLAGLYPSLVLAGFKPIQALRNRVDHSKTGGVTVRKSLVVLQFVIAQVLIIGAIVILMQLEYIRSRDLGFTGNLVYTFQVGTDSSSLARQAVLKRELLQIPKVETVAFSSDQPFSGNTWASNFRYGSRPEDEPYSITMKFADVDYQKAYDLELLAGDWYSPSDTMKEIVVNETLVRKLGIEDPKELVGKPLRLGASTQLTITGVVKDFHTQTLRREYRPLLISTNRDFYWETGVKLAPGNIDQTVVAMRQAFDKVMPEQVFEGTFLDERIALFYQDDDRLSATSKGFGLLAILISCLGLFGLATHAAQQRVKEIGIRKVLGASTTGIINLLSRDFLKLVLIALVIATPIAYYFMQTWLDDFAYRVHIKWWIFGLTGILALLMAFVTVSFQSVRAALANPVDSLRSE